MGKGNNEPPEIQLIFAKPGRGWAAEERARVQDWLFEPRQLQALLHFALYYLGEGATLVDAEDAWANFCMRRLDPHINLYDPARGRHFWNFLLFCFERFCWDEGERLRRRQRREPPLEVQIEIHAGETLELEWFQAAANTDPTHPIEQQETLVTLRQCVSRLPPSFHLVIILHYFEGQSVQKISVALGLSASNVKVRLHRARQHLARCLEKKGAAP